MSTVSVLTIILVAVLLVAMTSAILALVYAKSDKCVLDDRLRSVSSLTR